MQLNYDLLKKIMFKLDPETAHKLAEIAMVASSKIFPEILGFVAQKCVLQNSSLQQSLLGTIYNNPIGIAGGFDKNATMIPALCAMGFAYTEFGTFTPLPQKGNDKPRLFRLIDEKSIQNAMGFNNEGSEKILKRVNKIYPNVIPLWANIGKNKATDNKNATHDYTTLIKKFTNSCDTFVINISSPNTPNLRDLQDNVFIEELFSEIKELTTKPIILKISPDIEQKNAIELCSKAVEAGASGVIVANTSIQYSLSNSANLQNFGGLSGAVITQKSRKLLKAVADELFGHCVIISSGGIFDANDAYERLKMGASLIQLFTAFIYEGPMICKNINTGILERIKQDGATHISEIIGIDKGRKIAEI